MEYADRLENVTVLGAAGKMGSGILLLTAVEMAELNLLPENKNKVFVLNAMDVSQEGLKGVMRYLRAQVLRIAEKKTVMIRKMYTDRDDLDENSDYIRQYVEDVMSVVRPTTRLESAYESKLIFEAVAENKSLKVKLFSQIDSNNQNKPWYFTNTSSVPINEMEKEAGLDGRIIGFHFYNPPAVQKLVEIIKTDKTAEEVNEFAHEYAKRLRKIVVPSMDFAGFIGNGHFMRDALHGMKEAEELAKDYTLPEAIYMVNKVTQEYLVRPMGIFQLVDYVGIDVVNFIMGVMNPYLPDEELSHRLLEKMLELEVKGGQRSDGSQKDGFLKYDKGKAVAIFDPDKKEYVDINEIKEKCDEILGPLPEEHIVWKKAVRLKGEAKDEILAKFFNALKNMDTLGAELAINYGKRSKEIGEQLVNSKVAYKEEDVNTVMLTGFFHAYGPINQFFD
ncbi:MAG: 3-hydroxyacyl-CoA dehydrogenase family protein [Bacteroidales bacterium]|nr:3-hydroxyacyl-CoA dehydrogenase family protein [Bacteroidales bacterium]MCF8387562.1 3-hydroxyacyl-CoA dehydrogenase family protein [Bacteroidales bacterium]MCF8399156.1 3-hydroxyacyl-CoA dehydrogenase family protein [Bacteroidales bacterium]